MACKEDVCGFVSVSRDFTESFRKVIDKSTIKFVRSVKLETKSGKSEDKILVLTTWRLHLLSPKVPAKVEITFNFLEIQAMNTFPEHQVVIDTDKSSYSLRLQTRDHLDNVINYISFALSRILNSTAFAPSVCRTEGEQTNGSRKVSPSSETSVETQRACGGFSEAYAALCDYNGISCKEEVQWDVDTIYHSQDNREFNLLDFSHLESRDLAVIVAAIAYNTWFTKIYCKDMRIGSEVTDQVLHTLSKSSSMEELTLENVGLRSDFPQKLSVALSENPASSIHSLNLAHNTLDNQGVSNLIQQVCRLSKGLRLLNLSRTCLTSKGVVSLSQALCSSDEYSNSLLHLDLSRNPGVLSGEDASNLYLFLSQANCLVHLDLSGTDCVVDSLFTPLLRGCCADLSYLNLSRNSFSHRKGKDSLPVFRQFFSSAFSLTHVSLACMKLPPEALRALFLGLSANPHISDLHLDISGCELRCAGAAVIQELLPRVSSIGTLDISDNGLDGDLVFVLPALSRHPSLKHLLLGKNFNIKNRVLDEVLQKLVQLIQDEECGLQSLSLADSRLRSRGTVLVNALGSNTCLRKVDLSGNGLEDIGAKMLSKALQINTTLRSVMWDRNNTMSTGFMDVARALEHNFTLQYMPLPLSDVTQAYRNNPEKTEQALTKIQRALLRNNQTQRFSQRQALRLHQGLVTSTAEQVMERLCVRVQQQVCVLREAGLTDDIQAAKQVLKEARNSRALYPSLCELAHVLSVDGPVRQKLDSLAGELAKAADKELQVIVDSMVSLCRELCPMSSTSAERLSPSLSSVAERVCVPRSAIRGALMERAAQDIHRALEEVKLSVVSYLTNSIVDQLLQELYATHKSLTHHVADMKCWDGENETEQHLHRHRDSLDITDEELGTNIDTLAIRKRSGRTRRIRPVSSRLSVCDDSSSSTPPSAVPLSSPPLSSPLSRAGSSECLSALPTQGTPLSHVTRIRPRPPRKHRRAHAPVLVHCAENGAVTSLEDGLPDFYTKRVLPDSQLSSHHKAQSLRRKKRRNMLAIFSFRRSRQSALANHSSDTAEWGVACGEECRTVATTPSGTATENVYTLLQPPSHSAKADRLAEVEERKATEQMWDCNTHRQVSETERETERQTNGEKQSQRQSGEDQTGRRAHRLSGTDITSGRQTQKDRQSLDKETQECWETSIFQLGRIDAPDRQTISDRHVMSLTQMDRHIVSDPLIDRQVMSLTQITCDRQLDTFDRNITSPVLADRQSGSDTFHRMDCISSSKMPDRQDRHTYSRTVCGKNVDRQKTLAAHTAWRASSFRSGERQTQSDRVATTVTQHTGYITQADKQTDSRTQTERQTVSLTKTDRQTVCPMQTDRQTLCLTPAERQIVSRFHLDRQTGSSAQKESVMQADRQISVTNSQQDKQAVHVPQTSRHTVFITLLDRQKIPVTQTDGQTESITGSDIQTAYSDRQIGSVSHLDRPTVHSTQSDRHVGTVMQPDRQKMSITQSERQTIPVTQSDRQTRTDFQSDRKAGNELQPDIHSASVTHAERHVGIMIQSDRQTGSVLHIDRPTVPVIPTETQTGGVTQINKHSVQPDGQTGFIKQTDRETVPLTQTGCVQMGSLTQSDRQTVRPVKAVSLEESRRPAEGLQRAVSYGRKPDPPPQSSKPNLAKLRQRPLQSSSVPEADVCVDGGEKEKREDVDRHTHTHGPEKSLPNTAVREKLPQQSVACDTGNSQTACPGEECVKAAAPVKPLRNRKALSCDKGMDGEESNNTERPPNRKPPVKKPRLPQNRNRSLELLENGNAASPGNSVTP